MNWREISTSNDNSCFLYKDELLFSRKFKEVLKFHEPGLAPVRDESGAYHIDSAGNAIYPQRYSRTFGYYQERAAVNFNGRWCHIDTRGQKVYQETYVWAGNFQEKRCTVRNDANRYFHIDIDGKCIYPETYRYTGDYKDGIACVMLDDGLYKHINHIGVEINQKKFIDLGVFHKNFAVARDEKGWFHINKSGNELYKARYLMLEPFYNGYALATKKDFSKVVLDESGTEVIRV